MVTLYFATNNEHKLAEARAILADKVRVLSLADLHCTAQIAETADTLQGNALLKAQYVWQHYHVNCFADDTGLEVEALSGAPGVYTARFAERCIAEEHFDENVRLELRSLLKTDVSVANRRCLLQKLNGITQRNAQFRTAIAMFVDGHLMECEGVVRGSIATEEQGVGGFGYDSLFVPQQGHGLTFAQMDNEQKNSMSHRANALKAMLTLNLFKNT